MTATVPLRRLFFALWPESPVRRGLAELGRAAQVVAGGRAMQPDTLHMTLAFLGNIPVDRVWAAEAVAAGLSGRSFDLHLDRLSHWKHNHIVWAGAARTPEALVQLADELAEGLREAGLELEKRPFAAHVTLLRDAKGNVELPRPVPLVWPARDFVLVESKLTSAGARYEVVGRWPLQG